MKAENVLKKEFSYAVCVVNILQQNNHLMSTSGYIQAKNLSSVMSVAVLSPSEQVLLITLHLTLI
jgi:hypothetical protein